MKFQLVAVSRDVYWLAAIQKAVPAGLAEVHLLKCPGELSKCSSILPKPTKNTLVLLDASGQEDVEQAVMILRHRGWRYVIVAAADPTAKEATTVLRRNLGYDYWDKTYVPDEIRWRIDQSLKEIRVGRRRKLDEPRQPRIRFE